MTRYLPPVLVIALLAVAGLVGQPFPSPMGWENGAYNAAGFLALRAASPGTTLVAGIALAAAAGGGIELAQCFVPARSAAWGDLACDVVGFLVGWWLAQIVLGPKPPEILPPTGEA